MELNQLREDWTHAKNLLGEGRSREAKEWLDEFIPKYDGVIPEGLAANMEALSLAKRYQTALAVVGRDVPEDWAAGLRWIHEPQALIIDTSTTVIVVFWEVWCPHSRGILPEVEGLHESLQYSNLQFIGVTRLSRGSTEKDAQQFLESEHVSFPVAVEDGSLSDYFLVKGIPVAAIIKDGKIIWWGHPAILSVSMLQALM